MANPVRRGPYRQQTPTGSKPRPAANPERQQTPNGSKPRMFPRIDASSKTDSPEAAYNNLDRRQSRDDATNGKKRERLYGCELRP
jgi:hypothetical protein